MFSHRYLTALKSSGLENCPHIPSNNRKTKTGFAYNKFPTLLRKSSGPRSLSLPSRDMTPGVGVCGGIPRLAVLVITGILGKHLMGLL